MNAVYEKKAVGQLTTEQQLRESVRLIKPELLAEVPNDYTPRETFNYLRHEATNYDLLREEHRNKYGEINQAEEKALTQGAADVILGELRAENIDLVAGQANTVFARFARAMFNILGLSQDIDLQAIYQATIALKKSQAMYKSWNERYRLQKKMILRVARNLDPNVRNQIEAIYKANSKEKLERLNQELFR